MSDKPLYDELMNVAAEIGELEIENNRLKEEMTICEKRINGFKQTEKALKEWMLNQEIIVSDLQRKIAGASFKKRLRYLFTGKL